MAGNKRCYVILDFLSNLKYLEESMRIVGLNVSSCTTFNQGARILLSPNHM